MNIFKNIGTYFKKQGKNAKNDFLSKETSNDVYYSGVSPLSFLKLVKRYLVLFGIALVTLASASFAVGFLTTKDSYYCTGTISFSSFVHADLYTIVQEDIMSDRTSQSVAALLKDNDIVHSNGDAITTSEIRKGITTEHTSSSTNIIVKYQNYDEKIVVEATNALLDYIVSYYDDEPDGKHIKDFIYVGSYASVSFKDNGPILFYIVLGTIGSFCASFALIFFVDRIRKKIICPKDIGLEGLLVLNVRVKKHSIKQQYADDLCNVVKEWNTDGKTINIIPVGKVKNRNADLVLSLFKDNIKSNVILKDNLNNTQTLFLNNDEKTVFVFDCGLSSRKDINNNTKNEIINFADSCLGVFIE